MMKEGMIEITGADLVNVAKAAYLLSQPQGLGFLHYEDGGLSDQDAAGLVIEDSDRIALSLDYVKGRACKLTVFRGKDEGKLYIHNSWYDHTPEQLEELLARIGISAEKKESA